MRSCIIFRNHELTPTSRSVLRGCVSVLVALFSLILACINSGCSPERIELHLRPEIVRPPVCVVLFFVDGLDYSTLQRLRRFGLTPNIDRIFENGGVRVKNAIDCIPSTTYPNTVSLFTGMFPGHHGVVGNSWFDPTELISTDYMSADRYKTVNEHFGSKTIYERLDNRFTFNVQCPTQRGVAKTLDNPIAAGFAYAMGWFVNIDELVGSNINDVANAANNSGEWPSLLVHYFPGVDEIGHQFGSYSMQYLHAVKNADRQIGRIAGAIRDARPAQKVYFILVSDHCHYPVEHSRVVDIDDYLVSRRRMRTYSGLLTQPVLEGRRAALANYDAVVLHPSFRHCQIYLRGPDGWGSRPTLEQIRNLIAPEDKAVPPLYSYHGIGVVCIPLASGVVQVFTRRGEAIIERRTRETGYEYRFAPGPDGRRGDPLGYLRSRSLRKFVNDGWHSSREWLQATAASNNPDFVPQIVELFESPRAGHVDVFPLEEYVFKGHHNGEHGTCYRSDMRIPMYFAGPDLPADGEIQCARIVDIVPTILQMLGAQDRIKDSPAMDGIGLLDELRHARKD